jgi:hypothetical protein
MILVGVLYQPGMVDASGAFGGLRIGRRTRSARRKPTPVLQIPRDLGSNPGLHGLSYGTTHLTGYRDVYICK